MKTPPDPPLAPVDKTTGTPSFVDKQLIGRRMIREAALFVDRHLSRQPPVQRFFSFMPTMLTRVSPFHFKNRAKSKDWPLVRLDSGDVKAWGRMRVVGELLVIFDETVLFCLLSLMSRYQNEAFESTLVELSGIAGVTPTAANFTAIWRSIQRLSGTRIDLELTSGSGKKRRCLKEMTGSILSFADKDQDSGKIRIVVNPYFLEMYTESFVTNIDMVFRNRLKSDVSKAFYRFYQGQYETESQTEISRLARAVNLSIGQGIKLLKSKVRAGLKELHEKGYLDAYEVTRDDRVIISKARDAAVRFDSQILGLANIEYFID